MQGKENKMISRDLKRILCASTLSVVILVSVMIFSPLASQIDDDGLRRGAASERELDFLVEAKEYQSALVKVDPIIADKKSALPCFAYFDRFLSEQEHYEASAAKAEIYNQQWKRIEILQAKRNEAVMKSALEDYTGIIGYNQKQAKTLLKLKKEELSTGASCYEGLRCWSIEHNSKELGIARKPSCIRIPLYLSIHFLSSQPGMRDIICEKTTLLAVTS